MYLSDLASTTFSALPRHTPIVFPIAALEQHGPHLPLFTDSLLTGEIVRRSELCLTDRVVFAPVLWFGNSDHHLDFAGTLSAPPRTYLDTLLGLAENVLSHGFRRIVFLNGHGGNDVPGRQALFELRQRHRDRNDLLLLMATYWHLADPRQSPAPQLLQSEMGHACEWETSMILRLAPHLVGPHTHLPDTTDATPFQPAFRAWTTLERSRDGYIGRPAAATAEKGEHLFSVFSAATVQLLERVVARDGISWNE